MPVNKHLAQSLKRQYGSKEGERVYFAMENSGGKTGAAYKKGLATAKKEGHTAAHMKDLNKPKKAPKQTESQGVSRRKAHVGVGADDKGRLIVKAVDGDSLGTGADPGRFMKKTPRVRPMPAAAAARPGVATRAKVPAKTPPKATGSPIAPRAIAKRGDPMTKRAAPPAAIRSAKKGEAVDRRMGMPPESKSRRERK